MDPMEMMSLTRMMKGRAAGKIGGKNGGIKWMRNKDVEQGMASNKFSYARQAVSACSYFMHDQLAGLGASSGWAGRIAFQLTKRTTHPSTHVRAPTATILRLTN